MDMSLGKLWELVRDRRLGVLRYMGLQRVGNEWETELKWTERNVISSIIVNIDHVFGLLPNCFVSFNAAIQKEKENYALFTATFFSGALFAKPSTNIVPFNFQDIPVG